MKRKFSIFNIKNLTYFPLFNRFFKNNPLQSTGFPAKIAGKAAGKKFPAKKCRKLRFLLEQLLEDISSKISSNPLLEKLLGDFSSKFRIFPAITVIFFQQKLLGILLEILLENSSSIFSSRKTQFGAFCWKFCCDFFSSSFSSNFCWKFGTLISISTFS